MAHLGDVSSAEFRERDRARRRRAEALNAHAPTWLLRLGLLAFGRAIAIAGIAWWWLAHRDEIFGQTWIVAWAVCCVAFELFAGSALITVARVRLHWGWSLGFMAVAFGILAVALVMLVGAALFAHAPSWALALGLADSLVRALLIVAMAWPVVRARAAALEVRHYGPQIDLDDAR